MCTLRIVFRSVTRPPSSPSRRDKGEEKKIALGRLAKKISLLAVALDDIRKLSLTSYRTRAVLINELSNNLRVRKPLLLLLLVSLHFPLLNIRNGCL